MNVVTISFCRLLSTIVQAVDVLAKDFRRLSAKEVAEVLHVVISLPSHVLVQHRKVVGI